MEYLIKISKMLEILDSNCMRVRMKQVIKLYYIGEKIKKISKRRENNETVGKRSGKTDDQT